MSTSLQLNKKPIATKATVIQELYNTLIHVNAIHEAYMEDNGHANSSMQGFVNALMSFMSIYSMVNQPFKSIDERSLVHVDQTLRVDLNNMVKEIVDECRMLMRSTRFTRKLYETAYEGLLAYVLRDLLEQGKTFKDIMSIKKTQTDLIVDHVDMMCTPYYRMIEWFDEALAVATAAELEQDAQQMSKVVTSPIGV